MGRSYFQDLLSSIAERGRELIRGESAAAQQSAGDLFTMTRALLSGRGEASGVALAQDVLGAYAAADKSTRGAFLKSLALDYGPEKERLEKAALAYLDERSSEAITELTAASEPRRQEVIRRLNRAPGGTAALVRMRENVLELLRADPMLSPLDADFSHLLSSWFNRGFLVLRRIDWTTPANILAKITEYEAVHTIKSWDDLRNRLEPPDRRCYAFFHPQINDDPLIFVEVALTRDIPGAIAPLLDLKREPLSPAEASVAVFYSISNCQRGLAGISFGNFLIKQVVEELKREMPRLSTFVTLSPVPGFAKWLAAECATVRSPFIHRAGLEALQRLRDPNWMNAHADEVEEPMKEAAAAYFIKAKTVQGRPIDPVARFHLGNGARLERINFMGDVSPKGITQSYGLMVNYLYDLGAIERNHEAYAEQGEIVTSPTVQRLLRNASADRLALPVPQH